MMEVLLWGVSLCFVLLQEERLSDSGQRLGLGFDDATPSPTRPPEKYSAKKNVSISRFPYHPSILLFVLVVLPYCIPLIHPSITV